MMIISKLRLNRLSLIAAEEILKYTGIVRVKVISDSMSPLIKIGDWISFEAKKKKQIPKYGAIILCKQRYHGSLLIHRFYFCYKKHGKSFYITKADRSFKFDYPSSEEQYLGIANNIGNKQLFNIIVIIFSTLLLPLFYLVTILKSDDFRG